MIDSGLVDEVKSLLAENKPLGRQARCAIGYAEIINYLNGQTNLEDATELIKKNTRRLAKGQRTWFKTFKNVNWLDMAGIRPAYKAGRTPKGDMTKRQRKSLRRAERKAIRVAKELADAVAIAS